jgi:hypothetical protein
LVSNESEIDEFSRGFHGAIAGRMREADDGRDPPKLRYQLVDDVVRESPKTSTELEQAQKCPPMPQRKEIDKAQFSERKTSVLGMRVESESTSPSLPQQQLGRKFSWETVFEDDCISTVQKDTNSKPALPALLQLDDLSRKFSCISDDLPETPDLVRSSSLSSSSSSSASSTFSASSSISSTSTGPMLKFDPLMKDLMIVGHESSPESQDLNDFLEQLSSSILDRQSKRQTLTTTTLTSSSKLQLDLRARSDDDPASVDIKGLAEDEPSTLNAKFPASERLSAVSFIRPTDIFQRMMEDDEREKEATAPSEPAEGMINRRHPLRAKRKNRKTRRLAAIVPFDGEKRRLYPDGVSSLETFGIGIAI